MKRKAIIIILTFFALSCTELKREFTPVKVGDVWRWTTITGNNPFKETDGLKPYYDFKVLAIKGDFVQYMDLSDSTIESSTINMFKVGAERINKP